MNKIKMKLKQLHTVTYILQKIIETESNHPIDKDMKFELRKIQRCFEEMYKPGVYRMEVQK